MARRIIDREAPFQTITGAAYLTGLSAGFIRAGCKQGQIPHIHVGTDYRVNMPLWRQQLDQQSACNAQKGRP